MHYRKTFFLIISLLSFFKLSALIKDDFYINGELIQVDLPPYFDFECNCCEYHILNIPREITWEISRSDIYSRVRDIVRTNLKKAFDPILYDIEYPPYFWPQKDKMPKWEHGWQYDCRDWFIGFIFSRFSNDSVKRKTWSTHLEYSQYLQKYEYFYYLFNFYYDLLEVGFKNQIERIIAKCKKEKGFIPIDEKYEIEWINKKIKELPENKKQTIKLLDSSLEEIRNLFLLQYNGCLKYHENEHEQKNPLILYERGKLLHEKGEITDFVRDIFELAELGYSTPQIELETGRAYNELNLYNKAIDVLSKVLKKDPKNKEAYFERALAYFEKGDFDLAIEDYVNSSFKPTKLNENDKSFSQSLSFARGIGLGCLKGGTDSIVDFVPSLLYTAHGLGTTLWAFTTSPVTYSKEFIASSQACIEYIKENISLELLQELVPELRDCITNWNELDDEKRGYYFGYVISKYGIDILAWGGCAKGMELFRNLKRANAILTLESAVASEKKLNELQVASKDFFNQRKNYLGKCKIGIDDQKKHIPGSKNYKENTSDVLICIEELEAQTRPRLGFGLSDVGEFGKAGYKEYIEYEDYIGLWYDLKKGPIPTKCAKVHYNKKGEYHVVPCRPDIFELKRKQ